jgi:hypothetical protein
LFLIDEIVRLPRLLTHFSSELNEMYNSFFASSYPNEMDGDDDNDNSLGIEASSVQWEGLYLVLCIYEKILTYLKLPVIEKNEFVPLSVWSNLAQSLRHPHVWIRFSSFFFFSFKKKKKIKN